MNIVLALVLFVVAFAVGVPFPVAAVGGTSQGSPAWEAGLKAGDIIVEVDGVRVDKNNSLSELTQSYNPADEVELNILRGEAEEKIKVVLDSD